MAVKAHYQIPPQMFSKQKPLPLLKGFLLANKRQEGQRGWGVTDILARDHIQLA
jgi:hypothetical protein